MGVRSPILGHAAAQEGLRWPVRVARHTARTVHPMRWLAQAVPHVLPPPLQRLPADPPPLREVWMQKVWTLPLP